MGETENGPEWAHGLVTVFCLVHLGWSVTPLLCHRSYPSYLTQILPLGLDGVE